MSDRSQSRHRSSGEGGEGGGAEVLDRLSLGHQTSEVYEGGGEEAEVDESDGGLVRVGRVLGTFCLECLMMMITIMMMRMTVMA